MKEKIKDYLNQEITFITEKQVEYLKSFAGWEVTLFLLVNLVILFNLFFYLNACIADYLEPIYEKVNGLNLDAPANFLTLVDIMFKILPIFILIKYLILPATLWAILKYGKNNKIISLIKNIFKNYKIQLLILLITFLLDIVCGLINVLINSSYNIYVYHNYWYATVNYIESTLLFIGGLTGSYLVIFLFLWVYKMLKIKP